MKDEILSVEIFILFLYFVCLILLDKFFIGGMNTH